MKRKRHADPVMDFAEVRRLLELMPCEPCGALASDLAHDLYGENRPASRERVRQLLSWAGRSCGGTGEIKRKAGYVLIDGLANLDEPGERAADRTSYGIPREAWPRLQALLRKRRKKS